MSPSTAWTRASGCTSWRCCDAWAPRDGPCCSAPHILGEVEQVARQIEVVVAGRHAASGDFGVIRRLMTDRPMQYAVVADDDRRLGSVLIADPSVIGVSLRRQGGLDVSVSDLGAFAVRLPRMARENGIRILELTPER